MGGSCSCVSAARAETPQLDSAPQGQSAVQPSADGEAAVAEAREAAAREAEAQKWAAKDTEALPTEEAPQAGAEDERASAVAGALPTVPQMPVEDDSSQGDAAAAAAMSRTPEQEREHEAGLMRLGLNTREVGHCSAGSASFRCAALVADRKKS